MYILSNASVKYQKINIYTVYSFTAIIWCGWNTLKACMFRLMSFSHRNNTGIPHNNHSHPVIITRCLSCTMTPCSKWFYKRNEEKKTWLDHIATLRRGSEFAFPSEDTTPSGSVSSATGPRAPACLLMENKCPGTSTSCVYFNHPDHAVDPVRQNPPHHRHPATKFYLHHTVCLVGRQEGILITIHLLMNECLI